MRIALIVMLLCATASAQEYIDEPPRLDGVRIVHKNPRKPLALSVIGTLSGVAVLYGAMQFHEHEGTVMTVFAGGFMVISPAFGEWYVQDRPVFTLGTGLRLAGFAAGGIGVGADTSCNALSRMTGGGTGCVPSMRQGASDTMVSVGLLLGVIGSVYDIIDAPLQARERRIVVVPDVTPTSGGIGIGGTF